MTLKHRLCLILLAALLILPAGLRPAAALTGDPGPLPNGLDEWRPWVLYGLDEKNCPASYNDGETYHCAWPSRLRLDLNADGGSFSQEWLVLAPGWTPLPGGSETWPEKITVDGEPAAVAGRSDAPEVRLQPGRHLIEGRFSWTNLPEIIQVPPSSGLVSLSLNGRAVDFPLLDSDGRLWLQKRAAPESEADRLEVKVFRLLSDEVPMRVENVIRLNVAGRSREIKLPGLMLAGALPMFMDSPLPARLGPDGDLQVQARPGRWEIRLTVRLTGPVAELGPAAVPYGQEIWAFQAQNHLRMVKVEGAPSVDPAQTDAPREWSNLPVYLIDSGTRLTFREMRRGDPDPAPDRLNLRRTWWLDFDGKGFTVRDNITGAMSRQWFLAMNPPGQLGRVSVDGQDQLVTEQGPGRKPGVELRRGELNLEADSRFEGDRSLIPAVGWDHDFQSVSGELNLPPGWRLLAARGVDVLPGTWFQRWTLLDFFLVLIIAIAAFRLQSWIWGLLALAAVALTYHEPGAPRLVWLNLLAASALVRVLPEGLARRLAGLWRLASIVFLLAVSIPFVVQQVRLGVYPQLERTGGAPAELARLQAPVPMAKAPVEFMERPDLAISDEAVKYKKEGRSMLRSGAGPEQEYAQQALMQQDPNAVIQTGPGLPSWHWRTLRMSWNGPVESGQEVRLWLLSPSANMLLCFLRVVLLALLIGGLVDWRRWRSLLDMKKAAVSAALVLMMLPAQLRAAETGTVFPPPEILQELRDRLLTPPDCLPYCAEIPRMEMTLTGENLRILLELHAAVDTAVPLPGSAGSWMPELVLLDDRPAEGLERDQAGSLWMLAPAGVHTVVLTGRVPAVDSFQTPLPLQPRRAQARAEGWEVRGVHPDGRTEASVQFARIRAAGEKAAPSAGTELPPFLHVERVLNLGLEWQAVTTVRRVTPLGQPVTLSVPLLSGESVTTAGIRVEKGQALINMAPLQDTISWTSALEMIPEIRLTAPEDPAWTETWILNAGPVWHVEPSGLPVIHHQDSAGQWRPEWRPWPGESVALTVTRPKPIPGQALTIDEANLELTPGERFDKAGLKLVIRASQGGQHKMTMPVEAKVQIVTVNGRSQPLGRGGREVVVPLKPGRQEIFVEWHQPSGSYINLTGPEVNIGSPAVNAAINFNMPRNRWILWVAGPRLGPAVLFWSYVVVVVLAALGLGRISWTPLKTRHWLLLGLGLTQIHPLAALMIVGWLLTLGLRKDHRPPENWLAYDTAQIFLAFFTLAALTGLYFAVRQGLLGIPDMQIAGNGSSNFTLRWTQDRLGEILPQPWVLSLPRLVYNLLMLAWALWLALSLVKWLKWGWNCFGEGGLWRKPRLKRKKNAPPAGEEFLIE